ncbi:unnamed protein product [Ambrosiozyma monospora]|uniref:Unnamed protein product n=1 Tax=Ambrosiozyma monospora TaxID=43982 RepID=A0A9W6Z1J0_AMBMO|nr:unnamed protein product [Ambrosiozyma monospora]
MAQGNSSALMVDIQGAYDNVNFEKLTQIMRDLNFPEAMIRWTSHFTTQRTTTLVTHNNIVTKQMKVKMGIPQGSPASGLLFIIYTTLLIRSLNANCNVKSVGYMDDWTLYYTGNDFEKNTSEIEL